MLNGNLNNKQYGTLKKTTHQFIIDANNIHNNKYDYSLVEYVNNKTKIEIVCLKHGIFKQTPNSHLNGNGCPSCTNKNVTINDFIENAKLIHNNNKYDYSLVNYINNHTKIKIICSEHGIFEQTPNIHLGGHGCVKCAYIRTSKLFRKENILFINEALNIHNNKYDYTQTEYMGNKIKIKIICPIHGIFKQKPNDHLQGVGCPKCKQSKGEIKINQILKNNNIFHIYQKTFNNCNDIRKLQFDFYLPKQNICIEYDGEQHYKPINHFGGKIKFELQQKRDQIKTNYCIENNINLIRIRYDENIEDKLTPILKKINLK